MTFGQAGDIPAPGNYDGLGYDQIAVYRPSTGQFLVLEPNGTTETLNLGVGNSADLSKSRSCSWWLRQPSLFHQQSTAADRSGCVRSRHRCVYNSRTRWHPLHGVRVPSRRYSRPRRLPGERVNPAHRIPTDHRAVHRSRGGYDRDVWPVG